MFSTFRPWCPQRRKLNIKQQMDGETSKTATAEVWECGPRVSHAQRPVTSLKRDAQTRGAGMEVALHRVPRKCCFNLIKSGPDSTLCTDPAVICLPFYQYPNHQGKICQPCDFVTRVLVAKVLEQNISQIFAVVIPGSMAMARCCCGAFTLWTRLSALSEEWEKESLLTRARRGQQPLKEEKCGLRATLLADRALSKVKIGMIRSHS